MGQLTAEENEILRCQIGTSSEDHMLLGPRSFIQVHWTESLLSLLLYVKATQISIRTRMHTTRDDDRQRISKFTDTRIAGEIRDALWLV
jgi:hypothetical protein